MGNKLQSWCDDNKEKLKEISLLLVVLLIGLTFFFTNRIGVSTDSGWYMARAINLYKGRGFINAFWQPETYRGPVFMAIMAVYFKLFGPTITSGFWVVRTFFVGNLVLSYLLGRKLFNKLWGFIIFLFVLTAPAIFQNSINFRIDIALPFFTLLAIYVLVWAIETERWYFFAISGATIGIAYLTKATAGVFFALPVLLMIFSPQLRSKKFIRSWMLFYLSLFLTLLPWFIYLFSVGEKPFYEIIKGLELLLNPAHQRAGLKGASGDSFSNTFTDPVQFINLFIRYYEMDFAEKFFLAPVFIVAWMILGINTLISGSYKRSLILSSGILYLSLAPIQANADLGTRHSLVLYFLSFFAIAAVFWPSDKNSFVNKHKKSYRYFSVAVLIVLLVLQIFVGKNSWVNALKKNPPVSVHVEPLISDSEYWGAKSFADWFNDHSIKNPKILVTEIFGNFLYLFSLDGQPLTDFPIYESIVDTDIPPSQSDWLAIWNYRGWYGLNQVRSHVIAISESELIEAVNKNGVEYVVISSRSYPLIYYLYNHPDFALINGPDNFGNYIFAVSKVVNPISNYENDLYELQVGTAAVKFLNRLKEQRPGDYADLKEGFLKEVLHLSDKEIIAIQNKAHPLFDETTPMSHLGYVQRVYSQNGAGGVDQAIELQEEKLEWVEYQTETKRMLTTMYLYTGDYEKALYYIEDVMKETPDDNFSNNLYVLTDFALENDLTPQQTTQIYERLLEPARNKELDEDLMREYIDNQ